MTDNLNKSDSQELEEPSSNPLTIKTLLVWTAGVAIALTITKSIKSLSAAAWNQTVPYNPQETLLTSSDYLTAVVYGTCLALFLLVVASKDFWRSPGKIALMIFALICVIDWGLSVFAYTMIIQNVEVVGKTIYNGTDHVLALGGISTSEWVTDNFEIFGVHYGNFAPRYGYLVGIPIFLWIAFKSREQSWAWKLVWFGFVFFSVAMLLRFIGWQIPIPNLLPAYYFHVILGVPLLLMVFALASDLIRKRKVDGWTMVVCTGLPTMWLVMTAMQLIGWQ